LLEIKSFEVIFSLYFVDDNDAQQNWNYIYIQMHKSVELAFLRKSEDRFRQVHLRGDLWS
jgi:hypothetical protein